MRKLKVGQDLKITFLDHVESDEGPKDAFVFVCYGTLVRKTKSALVVASWHFQDLKAEKFEGNEKTYTIVKKAITDIQVATWS